MVSNDERLSLKQRIMTKLRVTLACGDYDRTRPLIEGKVNISGIDLDVTVLSSGERHSRFMRNLEFDVCELQVAQDLGLKTPAPITAIPVFPHRAKKVAQGRSRGGPRECLRSVDRPRAQRGHREI